MLEARGALDDLVVLYADMVQTETQKSVIILAILLPVTIVLVC